MEVSATHVYGREREQKQRERMNGSRRSRSTSIADRCARCCSTTGSGDTWVIGSTLYATRPGRPRVVAMENLNDPLGRAVNVV